MGGNGPRVWESFMWGLLSAVSLNIGSIIGVTCLPKRKVRAILMSFGGGALLFALSIELFGHGLHVSEETDNTVPVWFMIGSAILGGIFFASLNRVLNSFGADMRRPVFIKVKFAKLRALLLRRLASRLTKIPLFSVLSVKEITDLIQSAMYKERFNAGDIIMSRETRDGGLCFIISGLVHVQVYDNKGEEWGDTHHLRETDASHLVSTWDLGPNQIFGDMTVLTGQHVEVVVCAVETTKVLVLPGHEVTRLIEGNPKVRDYVSVCAVERLRKIEGLHNLPGHALAKLSTNSNLVTFQPGESIFEGTVNENTPVLCVVIGTVEVKWADGTEKLLHANRLLCAEHFQKTACEPFVATAVEHTSVLVITRDALNKVMPSNPGDIDENGDDSVIVLNDPPTVHVHCPVKISVRDEHASVPVRSSLPSPVHAVVRSISQKKSSQRKASNQTPAPLELPGQVLDPCAIQQKPITPCSMEDKDELFEHLGHDLGWDRIEQDEDEVALIPRTSGSCEFPNLLITDQELEEREVELTEIAQSCQMNRVSNLHEPEVQDHRLWTPERKRTISLQSFDRPMPKIQISVSQEDDATCAKPIEDTKRLLVCVPDAVDTPAGSSTASRSRINTSDITPQSPHHGNMTLNPKTPAAHGSSHAAIMVWLGILIDAVPESLIIGIIVNKAAADGDTSIASATLPFVIGVFLSNLPESMSSSGSMKAHHMPVSVILLMWLTITVLTAVGASSGALLFPPESSKDDVTLVLISSVEGLAAGAMLTMIAQTMMPEAYEQGGDVVGLSCLAGFLCALSVRLIPTGGGH